MEYSKIQLTFELDITIGQFDLVLSAGIIPDSGFLMFGIQPDPEKRLAASDVITLMGGNNWVDLVPEPLMYALNNITFQGFLATVFYNLNPPEFDLTSIAVSIGSDPALPIKLFGPFTDFIYRFIFTVSNPTEPANTTKSANFFAEVIVAGPPQMVFDIEIAT